MAAKTSRLLPALFIFLFLGGCWDVEEINRRATADAIFLDLAENGLVRLGGSAHIPGTLLPPYSGAQQQLVKRHFMLYGEGRGTLEAWKELQTRTNRTVYFSQTRALIIGEKYAKKAGLSGILDFFDRRGEISGNLYVLITATDPRDLLDMKLENNMIPGNYIADYLQSAEKDALALPSELWQVEAALLNGTSDVYLPCIEPSQGLYRIAGGAVFAGNAWAGRLNVEETQLLALLRGASHGYLTVPLPGGGSAAFSEVEAKVAIEAARTGNGAPRFEVGLKVKGALGETRPKNLYVAKEDADYYAAAAQRLLEARLAAFLRKLQELGSDPIGFGNKLRIRYPRYWQGIDWHRVFPAAVFRVRVRFALKNTGKFQ